MVVLGVEAAAGLVAGVAAVEGLAGAAVVVATSEGS
jgi:hypothetical protein